MKHLEIQECLQEEFSKLNMEKAMFLNFCVVLNCIVLILMLVKNTKIFNDDIYFQVLEYNKTRMKLQSAKLAYFSEKVEITNLGSFNKSCEMVYRYAVDNSYYTYVYSPEEKIFIFDFKNNMKMP
ncbi:hypothetical protein A3Q56_00091 [Intoshia linei]|uniref:Uncharacterized protein n=1 Tax=Intoshia linei TaxID=1819745 RepID=A0A177BD58_9BILA|nr:hypothetical protein A3Q56_00091 [Intoshia linei]